MTDIIVALITGGLAVIGVIISNKSTENKIQQQLIVNQAVYDTKLEELTREVRLHNDFATKIPQLRAEIEAINEKINIYHRKD